MLFNRDRDRSRIEAPRQIGQPAPAQSDITTTHTPGRFTNIKAAATMGTLKTIAAVVGLGLFVLMFVYASAMIHSLFAVRLGAPGFEAWLAVAASVGVVFGTLLIALTSDKNSVKGLAGLYLFVWLLLTLTLISLEATVRGGLLSVPESFASIGRVIAAILAAIALVPAISIPLVAMQPDRHTSAAAAIGSYIGFVAKGVAVAASIFASAYFGLSRGMPVEVAVLCGFVIESCFLWSYFSLIKAVQRHDGFDMALWAIAVVTFGAFIALISVETISTLSKIEVPLLRPFADAGATLFTSAVGLAVILTVLMHVLTSIVDVRLQRPDGVIDANARPLSRRVADSIIGARQARREIGAAWRGELPAPAPAQPSYVPVAKDAQVPETVLLDDEAEDRRPKA